MLIRAIRTRIFREGEPLVPFITRYIRRVKDGSIVVVTSKIVSLSEGRVSGKKGRRDKERVIKSESQWAMRTEHTWLTIKDDMVMSSAGVDEVERGREDDSPAERQLQGRPGTAAKAQKALSGEESGRHY